MSLRADPDKHLELMAEVNENGGSIIAYTLVTKSLNCHPGSGQIFTEGVNVSTIRKETKITDDEWRSSVIIRGFLLYLNFADACYVRDYYREYVEMFYLFVVPLLCFKKDIVYGGVLNAHVPEDDSGKTLYTDGLVAYKATLVKKHYDDVVEKSRRYQLECNS